MSATLPIWAFRVVVAMSLLTSPAYAAKPDKAVRDALSRIQSATGMSVLDRIDACGITFADGSYAEMATADYPAEGIHKGDLIVEIYINVEPLPDQDRAAYTDILARWTVSHGVAHAQAGWADWLQNKPAPIGSAVWMNC